MQSPWTTVTRFVDSVSRCYAEVLFINRGGAIGICILLCTMVNPNIGLSGLLAVCFLCHSEVDPSGTFAVSTWVLYVQPIIGWAGFRFRAAA